MLSEPVLVDTGPLVALYSANDAYHGVCTQQMDDLPVGKAFTCWPVIVEAAYMLRRQTAQRDDLIRSIIDGRLILLSLRESDLVTVTEILNTYHDQQVDLADACLLHLANREGVDAVFTLDRRHFSVFRKTTREALRLLPESI